MATSHHREQELQERFLDQLDRTARREYPRGRMGAEDDGLLSYAVAVDRRNQTVIIRYGKPVEWIGLGPEDIKELQDRLSSALVELQVGVV